ncbi:hypothetical protein BDV95DRAFT_598011 [Massariosphaeria phaeospora]|uniref:F-box domain-containing protein n=1 Tax=Massariosphaeria phaeospora TaxID=100035 RepID=A0A7C8I0E7_9PLEO|nr:hypothetical protein BDV95DRAFT_598011 [Massariosphaeria phaeospora]
MDQPKETPSQATQSTTTDFLGLPREIRDMIYLSAMDDLPSDFVLHKDGKPVVPEDQYSPKSQVQIPLSQLTLAPGTLPGICFTNHQIRKEATLVRIGRTNFVLKTQPKALMKFLEQFGDGEGFRKVRSFTFINPYNMQHLQLLTSHFPTLRKVTVEVNELKTASAGTWYYTDYILVSHRSVTPEKMEARLHLKEVMRIASLKEFVLICVAINAGEHRLPNYVPREVLRDYLAWFPHKENESRVRMSVFFREEYSHPFEKVDTAYLRIE